MGYLREFQTQLDRRDYSSFMELWEEYCAGDVDGPELITILKMIKASEFAPIFGKQIQTVFPLWEAITDPNHSYEVFKLIIDLQVSNLPKYAEMTLDCLKEKYAELPFFNEKIRLVGLRTKDNFQGAISNFELLNHMAKGKFVFHNGGWGTGEIMDLSLVREQLVIEFENVTGLKEVSFTNAFKTLIPLADDHFLSKRFGNPDALEEEARKEPVAVIRRLLTDLGPKTAGEIKDELSNWVIPEEDWSKWWQNTRAKIKKDTLIESPSNVREPFRIRQAELTHEVRFQNTLSNQTEPNQIIDTIYGLVRDYSEILKNPDLKTNLKKQIEDLLAAPQSLTEAQKVQLHILLFEIIDDPAVRENLLQMVKDSPNLNQVIKDIQIGAFKKRVLVLAREGRSDWVDLFSDFLFSHPIPTLRDYLLKELSSTATLPLLKTKLLELLDTPSRQPELFIWYFQKLMAGGDLPFADKEGQCRFFEGLLMLLSQVETNINQRDQVKKIHAILSNHRFATVRSILEGTNLEYAQEFLLLVSKCQSLTDHDRKILRSLAEVVHPSLAKAKKQHPDSDEEIIWTTPEGYRKVQQRIQQIGTVETVENAKEIEAARAHGDLRENSEYKFALEKRARLQGELKLLTTQLNKARLITEADISKDEVGVGSVVELANTKGEVIRYTLLGPWDADPDNGILALQSKFAQALTGLHVGGKVNYQDEEYTIKSIFSFLDLSRS